MISRFIAEEMNVHTAKKLLANMPDEVFTLYIEPLIQLHGWPFDSLETPPSSETDLWIQMFDHHSLKTISELSWERTKLYFSMEGFHQSSQERIEGIINTHVLGMDTPYAKIVNARTRFYRCLDYVKRTGTLPEPVVLMEDWSGLRILDGNHRLAAMAALPNRDSLVVDCWIGTLFPNV